MSVIIEIKCNECSKVLYSDDQTGDCYRGSDSYEEPPYYDLENAEDYEPEALEDDPEDYDSDDDPMDGPSGYAYGCMQKYLAYRILALLGWEKNIAVLSQISEKLLIRKMSQNSLITLPELDEMALTAAMDYKTISHFPY